MPADKPIRSIEDFIQEIDTLTDNKQRGKPLLYRGQSKTSADDTDADITDPVEASP